MEAIRHLLPQLSATAAMPTQEHIEQLIACQDNHLFVAFDEQGEIVGMLTLVLVTIPTSRKAWIEDVVTDVKSRGCGIGRALVERAVETARNAGVKRIYLTSNPTRTAAHALYKGCGFTQYDTTLFRMEL